MCRKKKLVPFIGDDIFGHLDPLQLTYDLATKDTTFERADFTIQLLMFVTAEKEGKMFFIPFLSSFYQLFSPHF